jgi:hypothetical protein
MKILALKPSYHALLDPRTNGIEKIVEELTSQKERSDG